MAGNFISWLQFPYTNPQIQASEQKILEKAVNNLMLKYLEISPDFSGLKQEKIPTFSFLISEENYAEITGRKNRDIFICHKFSNPLYVRYSYAVHNLTRFYPDKPFLDFEEIKGLNILDKILVPDEAVKHFLIKNHIAPEKIVILPSPLADSASKPENFENSLKELISNIFTGYKNYRAAYLKNEDYSSSASARKLRQVAEQAGKYGEITGIAADPLLQLPGINFKTPGSLAPEHLAGASLLLNQVLETTADIELKKIIFQAVNQFSYLIISCRSENYPGQCFRSKDRFLELVGEFPVIRETYYGDPDLRLAEKELFLIVIRGNRPVKEPDFVTWEGPQFFYNSLAAINRELELKMLGSGKYELSIIPKDFYQEVSFKNYPFYQTLQEHINKILLKKTDFYIRHNLPAGFVSPSDGYYILIIPWEFGKLPASLVGHINREADRVWCPSHYVRELHIASGVLENKLKVIPNGINPEIYHPGIPPLKLTTGKSFKFLFLGGIIYRKGIDVLIDAFTEEFRPAEDVSLVIKGLGQDTYYNSGKMVQKIREIAEDPHRPEIILIDRNFSIAEMGSIYTACDCYVHPYRGEGFCMPLAEAMACGLPVITTGYGPSLDFCSQENSFLIDYHLEPVNDSGQEIIVAEPDKASLKKYMRYAFENQEQIKKMGASATDKITNNLSWDKIFALVEKDFAALKKQPVYRKNIAGRINELVQQISSLLPPANPKSDPVNPNVSFQQEAEPNQKRAPDQQKIPSNQESEPNQQKVPSLSERGDLGVRAEELEKIITDRTPYLEILGDTYFYLNDYKKALECFSALMQSAPDKKIIIKLADTLEKLGDRKTAEALRLRSSD
jgi:glycosyltransferase involved in cell wall biosynthesis